MSVLIFLLVLVALILVHEFGHFLIAKRSGIRVDEFGIGFPPRLFGKKYGETLYSLNAIPFGGFVKIFGEDREEVDKDDKDISRAMFNKGRWAQATVLFGGVFFNILFAWIIFAATFSIGTTAAVTEENKNFISGQELVVAEVLEGAPASEAGFLAEDVILGISARGEAIQNGNADEVASFIERYSESELTISYLREDEEGSVSLTPVLGLLEDESAPAIGVAMVDVGELKYPLHLAIFESGMFTLESLWAVTLGILGFLGNALLLSADLSQIAGPVGIVSLVGDASALGFVTLLSFTAFISLNLAVINLLPFPALDGGRLVFLGIEAIKGSPIKPKVARMANGIGFALLIFLMLAVTYSDVLRLVG
ncbi:MAG: site-2 protease family protein [Candidatus Pacebacteria bacterium]|jgi:regulator of sigma E protease|nr:hypothetical protein [bacterium]MDP6527420.1 site-2 protease family protein [Candidatus Paceibacterota bacterium]MDP6659673.1 site-2 protease family protein [Candidatus Paceibacterota bacterium]|tara:strand:+ start:12218 stop:13318 length:1101 start_codon:yes stop_codon:yes gene_type:complete